MVRRDDRRQVFVVAEVDERGLATGAEYLDRDGRLTHQRAHVVIVAGDSAIDEAPVTGESIPVRKGVDAKVFAGTVNGDAALRVEEVWLCGVAIKHDEALIGHSDADAGLHALTDAILGAIGEGDIGDHFPPTDPKWKGAASDQFLKHAAGLVLAKGGSIINVDVTLICERPKIKPHRQAMRERLAEILNLPLDRVSVKATTTENLGFTGRGEGIAAMASATVRLPAGL